MAAAELFNGINGFLGGLGTEADIRVKRGPDG